MSHNQSTPKNEQGEPSFLSAPKGVERQYKDWFLYYASYVILERAIPAIEDGLKPVQRRILHAMNEMDDGRFSKVANIIGQSMQYHPHGDASIGDALVHMGQKDFLVETQGNWGDVRTGDQAAASRYIEGRLSKIAKQIAFNPKLTDWQLSYDGRKKEPITLPMKFPLLLLHGADGIAVGLSTKILPHNFIEICNASIAYLRGKNFELYPDFQTGGMVDISQYKAGKRGGKVKIRCKIEEVSKHTLVIKDTPFSVTTTQLIESIAKAGEQGKIKLKKITDNTAEHVEIFIELASGVTTTQTIDALYSFTKCQVSVSTNACVIYKKKPYFLEVNAILKKSVDYTKSLLNKELEINIAQQQEAWHYTSLEKIFFEEKIYKKLENKKLTWEQVLQNIDNAFSPFKKNLKKGITLEDIQKLVEKPVRRIHKLDIDELNAKIKKIEDSIQENKKNIAEIVQYTISWFDTLKKEFKDLHQRRTLIQMFYEKKPSEVAIKNEKLYANFKEGFVGTSLKKDTFICGCSDMDEILAISKQGKMKVFKVADKVFMDKRIIDLTIFRRTEETFFNMIYVDGKTGITYAKRFSIGGVTRDKEYDLTQGTNRSQILYLSRTKNPEVVDITLSQNSTARIKNLSYDFAQLSIGSRSIKGNQVTKYSVSRISLNKQKPATGFPKGKKVAIYYDPLFGRTNRLKNGHLVDLFSSEQIMLIVYTDGFYELVNNPLEEKIVEAAKLECIHKLDTQTVCTAIYYDTIRKEHFIKRFKIEAATPNQKFSYLTNRETSKLILFSVRKTPVLRVNIGTKKDPVYVRAKTNEWSRVVNIRLLGSRLPIKDKISDMNWID